MPSKDEKFAGFQAGKFNWVQIPAPFFSELLPLVDDLAELKLLLFCFWALPQKEGAFAYFRLHDFLNNEPLMSGLAVIDREAAAQTILTGALDKAVNRGALLHAEVDLGDETETFYFVNSPHGRTAVEQVKAGQWRPGDSDNPIEILPERPNIYRLYEDNIGPLTPLIADELKDIEADFPVEWIEEAIRIAIQKEVRHLRFIRAVLDRWRKEGKDKGKGTGEDGDSYGTGKYADFIKQ